MKLPKIFPEKDLHKTDVQVISEDFKNRSDFLATALNDTNLKLDALTHMLDNFELKPIHVADFPHLIANSEMTQKITSIEHRIIGIDTVMRDILTELKSIHADMNRLIPLVTPVPQPPTINPIMPTPGVGPIQTTTPTPAPQYRVTCDNITTPYTTAERNLADEPDFQRGFTVRVKDFTERHTNDPAYNNHRPWYDKYEENLPEPMPYTENKEEEMKK